MLFQVVQNFKTRLSSFGVTVKELSGDQSLSRQQIQETQVPSCTHAILHSTHAGGYGSPEAVRSFVFGYWLTVHADHRKG